MPIYVKRSVDPGSTAARRGRPTFLAGNAVSDELSRLVRSYVNEEVRGRSYLISGHRGSGKTTLIRKIVQDLDNEFTAAKAARRPLLVTLQGPMLLPVLEASSANTGEETQKFLEQIAVNLYRALADHVADEFEMLADERWMDWRRRREFYRVSVENYKELSLWKRLFSVQERFAQWLVWGQPTPRHIFEMQEIARDLRLKLDGPVDLAELREYWRVAGALDYGVLFPKARRPGQGGDELVAVWSCLRAYLTLASSEYELTAKANSQRESKAEASAKTADGKSLLAALSGLAGGSAVAAVLQQATGNLAASALWGVASGIASTLLLSYSASRSRSSTASLESSLKMKRDMQTLARELPELLARCRTAGLAPIFLVDELDKVEKLESRMERLVQNTKFFVTDQAIFFFATDRSYYESLRSRGRGQAYSRDYTFFNALLFVAYRPEDWKAYLRERLRAVNDPTDPEKTAENALEILIAVLLCRSRMHAIDLQRELAKAKTSLTATVAEDAEAMIETPSAELLRGTRFQVEVFMQCAAELALGMDLDLVDRCAKEPSFRQITYDALYYLSRLWQEPARNFRLNRGELKDHLNSRSGPVIGDDDDTDLEHLFLKVQKIAFWLKNPRQLADEWQAKYGKTETFNQVVVERIAAAPPLLEEETAGDFHWRYDPFGRTLFPVKLQEVRENEDLRHKRELIRQIGSILKGNTDDKVDLGALQKAALLSATPLIQDVFAALDRLEGLNQAGAETYEQIDEDARWAQAFGDELRERGETIARVVVSSWMLSRVAVAANVPPQEAPADAPGAVPAATAAANGDHFSAGWDCLSARLSTTDLPAQAVLDFADGMYHALQAHWDIKEDPLKGISLYQYDYPAWFLTLAKAVELARSLPDGKIKDWRVTVQSAWRGWVTRMTAYLRGVPLPPTEINDRILDTMFCWIRNLGPERWLVPNLQKVSLRGWSREFYLSLMNQPDAEGIRIPRWLGIVAALMTRHPGIAKDLLAAWEKESEGRAMTDWESAPELVRQIKASLKAAGFQSVARPGTGGLKLADLKANMLVPDPKKTDAPAPQGALVLCAAKDSATASWQTSPTLEGFAFTAEEMAGIGKLAPLSFKFAAILIEIGDHESIDWLITPTTTAADVLRAYSLLDYYDDQRTRVGILVKTPVAEEIPSLRFLYQCSGLDDAVSRLSAGPTTRSLAT